MTEEVDVIKSIAFLMCQYRGDRPCADCVMRIEKEIKRNRFLDTQLIEDFAIIIRNNGGSYSFGGLTPLELKFAYRVLIDFIPEYLDRIEKETDGYFQFARRNTE